MAHSTLSGAEARIAERRRLSLVLLAALACAAVAVTVSFEPIRIAAALPLCLVFPGYALAATTFAPGAISRAHRCLVVLALSLAVLALGALILNHTPGGIQEVPWAILLVAVTLLGWAVAWFRPADPSPQTPLGRPRVRVMDAALLVGAALTIAAATVIARTPMPAENIVGFTSLSMLHARSDGKPGLLAEIVNNERVPVDYRLVISQRRGPDRLTRRFTLAPGERYEEFAPLSLFLKGGRHRLITARLYRLDDPPLHPYRRVNAWIKKG